MAKTKQQALDYAFRDLCSLTVETDGIEMMGGEGKHILLSTRDEEYVALVGQLFKAEHIIFHFFSSIQKPHFTEWTVHFNKVSHSIAEHRFFRRRMNGICLSLV